jgi:hypothetical protein
MTGTMQKRIDRFHCCKFPLVPARRRSAVYGPRPPPSRDARASSVLGERTSMQATCRFPVDGGTVFKISIRDR